MFFGLSVCLSLLFFRICYLKNDSRWISEFCIFFYFNLWIKIFRSRSRSLIYLPGMFGNSMTFEVLESSSLDWSSLYSMLWSALSGILKKCSFSSVIIVEVFYSLSKHLCLMWKENIHRFQLALRINVILITKN